MTMCTESNAFLGLGANLGDPVQQIVDARKHLAQLTGTRHLRSSSLYLSSPVGYEQQAKFVNCVVQLTTTDSAQTLLSHVQSIESCMGRVRDQQNQNAPRIIDIDLLIFGDATIQSKNLVVPHPRMHERLFVLLPLLELLQQAENPLHADVAKFEDLLALGSFEQQIIHRLVV